VFLGLRFGFGRARVTLGYLDDRFLASLRHSRDLNFGICPFPFLIR
jgi:hypothetical protein